MNDLGHEALSNVFKRLLIDEKWSSRRERSFSWIGSRLAQAITASHPTKDGDFMLTRLVAECVVIESVTASEELVYAVLSQVNKHAIGNCYTYYPSDRCIYSTTSTWIHEETASWRTDIFSAYAIGQLVLAEAEADFLAEKCAGRVAVRQHPSSGFRTDRDDMLNALGDIFIPDGQEKSRFINEFEFKTVEDIARESPFAATIGGDKTGIALETSFANHTSLSLLKSDTKHRLLGSGLVGSTHVPTDITEDGGNRIAAVLNRKEREGATSTKHYGAWCVDMAPSRGIAVTYNFFVPNRLYRSGLIMDAAYGCIGRARWVDLVLNAEVTPPSAWDNLLRRFGFSSDKN